MIKNIGYFILGIIVCFLVDRGIEQRHRIIRQDGVSSYCWQAGLRAIIGLDKPYLPTIVLTGNCSDTMFYYGTDYYFDYSGDSCTIYKTKYGYRFDKKRR